jgi:hypothetical protein
MKNALRFLSLLLLTTRAWGQPPTFSRADSLTCLIRCRDHLEGYLVKLSSIAESGSPNERLDLTSGLIDEYFLQPKVLVFNEMTASRPELPIVEYASLLHPRNVRVSADVSRCRYTLGYGPQGVPLLTAYLLRTIEYDTPRQKVTSLLSVQCTFGTTLESTGLVPKDFKIVRIQKADRVPLTAAVLSPDAETQLSTARTSQRTLSQAARRLARSLHEHMPRGAGTVFIEKFSYDGSQLTNDFSDQLAGYLRHWLSTAEGQTVASQPTGSGMGVRGKYHEQARHVAITAELYDLTTGQTLRTLPPNTDLPMNWVEEKGLILRPGQNDQALATQQVVVSTAPAPLPTRPENLKVELRTSLNAREFWENDTMYVQVRVNKPCHLRLLYVQSDHTPALLWNDLEVKADQVGRDLVFPAPFVCVPPFGQEILVATASTEPFCPLKTHRNEFDVEIVDGTLAEAMQTSRCTTRGMARVLQTAEARLLLTTRPVRQVARK